MRGFTLIEMLAVLVLIGLAGFVFVGVRDVVDSANMAAERSELQALINAFDIARRAGVGDFVYTNSSGFLNSVTNSDVARLVNSNSGLLANCNVSIQGGTRFLPEVRGPQPDCKLSGYYPVQDIPLISAYRILPLKAKEFIDL